MLRRRQAQRRQGICGPATPTIGLSSTSPHHSDGACPGRSNYRSLWSDEKPTAARVCSISDSAGTFLCLRAASIWNETEITRLAVEWARYLKGFKHAPLFLPSQIRATLLAGRQIGRAHV